MAVIEEELLGLAGGFERFFLCGGGGEVDDDLREFGDDAGEVGEGFVSFADDFGEHEAGQDAVASSLAWENDVARLLAAELDVLITHGGGNVGVADGGDFGGNISGFGPIEETLVGHDGDGDVVEMEEISKNSDDLIAVDEVASVVDTEATVAIAIVGDAEIEVILLDECLEGFRVSGATFGINFGIVMLVGVDELSFGTEVGEN